MNKPADNVYGVAPVHNCKPCPFCGGEQLYFEDDDWDEGYATVVCFGCKASGPWAKGKQAAGEAWDKRK